MELGHNSDARYAPILCWVDVSLWTIFALISAHILLTLKRASCRFLLYTCMNVKLCAIFSCGRFWSTVDVTGCSNCTFAIWCVPCSWLTFLVSAHAVCSICDIVNIVFIIVCNINWFYVTSVNISTNISVIKQVMFSICLSCVLKVFSDHLCQSHINVVLRHVCSAVDIVSECCY